MLKRRAQALLQKATRWRSSLSTIEVAFGVFFALLVLAILLPESPLYKPFLARDSGVFHYIGWLITQGQVPYRDVWDHKPPLIFFINALGLLLGGGSRWGVWGLEVLSLFLSVMLGFNLLKKYFGILPSFLASLCWLITLPHLLHGGNFTTEYGIFFQFLFMGIFSRPIFKKYANKSWLALGALSALLFFCKQNLIGLSVAAGLVTVFMGIRRNKFSEMMGRLTHFVVGAAGVVGVFGIYFFFNHALKEFWEAAFLYNFAYIEVESTSRLASLAVGLRVLKTTGLSYLALRGYLIAVVGMVARKSAPPALQNIVQTGPPFLLFLLDFPLELALVSLSGRTYQHYFMALLPIFSFFTALMFRAILTGLQFLTAGKWWNVWFCCAVASMLVLGEVPYRDHFFPFCPPRNSPQIQDRVRFIEDNSAPKDKILVRGAETSLYFLSKRASASRFVYQYPLIQNGYGSPQMWDEFLVEVVSNKPLLIVDATRNNFIFMGYEPGYKDGELFISQFLSSVPISENCKREKAIMDWDMYRCNWNN